MVLLDPASNGCMYSPCMFCLHPCTSISPCMFCLHPCTSISVSYLPGVKTTHTHFKEYMYMYQNISVECRMAGCEE